MKFAICNRLIKTSLLNACFVNFTYCDTYYELFIECLLMILSLYVKISYTLKVQWRLPSHFDLKKLRIVYENL